MKFWIKHEIHGRIRVHLDRKRLRFEEADLLQYYMEADRAVVQVKIYEHTADLTVIHQDRERIIRLLRDFTFDQPVLREKIPASSGRRMNDCYKQKLIMKVLGRYTFRYLLPNPLRNLMITTGAVKYVVKGLACLCKGKIEVPVLDAAAIGASLVRGDYNTASSVMFLLGIGELLEEWTHKKSVDDLARSMSLHVEKVWVKQDGQQLLVGADQVHAGDQIVVSMGNIIPFDGVVTEGEALINQSSLTGEGLPVRKEAGSYVYAGTVVEEGELTVQVREASGSTKYEKIIKMIEDSEKLKSGVQSKAEHLADSLVPYTFLGTGLTYLITRNLTKAISILMVDFSCALKLAMPITVLTAIRDANRHCVTVKGGKFLELFSEAQTIVFDKTGTLTKAAPTVQSVVTFGENDRTEMLRIAACLEEHFPHSMARAVVDAAREENLEHEEMHSRVDYVVAHGIASKIDEKKVVIGSYHFVFEDEACRIPEGEEERFAGIPADVSHLYLAINHVLAAVICIEDPIRPEAADVISRLHQEGFDKIVMMTGDSERTAASVAASIGVDAYFSEVLPEDKAGFIQKEKDAGRTVVMIGDGINDSPALSAADVGLAISDGAAIAREIADITIEADDLQELVFLRRLSRAMMRRIHKNYRAIMGINGSLIAGGVAGLLQPTTSALLHNTSTLAIGLKSMRPYSN